MSEQSPELRASDSDRERTAEVLRHAASEGRLTVDELEERVNAAYAARTRRELDLNAAELSDRVTQLNVYSLMGGAEIYVPHGVNVHVSNFALMGGNETELGNEVAPPGAPTIQIRLVSVMGGTTVYRGPKLSRRERRELKKAQKRERQPDR